MNKIFKYSIYFICLFIINILFCNALEYKSELTLENTNITNYIGFKEGYITIDNNINTKLKLYNYNNEELISKELINLENSSIIKKDDFYIVVGTESNMLTIYYLDKDLKVIKYIDTSYSFINTTYNLYTLNDYIYILPIKNNNLNGINIYELNNNKELSEKTISSYSNIIDILKSDYYLINNTMTIKDTDTYIYTKSTYKDNNNYLIGYIEDEELNKNPILSIYNKENNKINEITDNNYNSFIDIDIINENVYILSKTLSNTYEILKYDLNLNYIDKISLPNKIYNKVLFTRINDNLIIICNIDTTQEIYYYTYDTKIITNDNIYGTVTFSDNIKPYNNIDIKVEPNSGYILKDIIIKDDKGNLIPYKNGYFKMPSSNAYVEVQYDTTITNPETVDNIIIITIIVAIMLIITIKLYKKFKWLQ